MKRLAFAMVTLFATIASANAQIVTKYSGIQPIEHPSSYAEKYFAEEVGLLTKGTVKVEAYANTQLGDAVANVQSVRNGTIGFTRHPAAIARLDSWVWGTGRSECVHSILSVLTHLGGKFFLLVGVIRQALLTLGTVMFGEEMPTMSLD